MIKTYLYSYQGVNGTLQTPILLEGVPHVTLVRLTAASKKSLTKDNIHYFKTITVSENSVDEWREVKTPAGQ